MLIAEVLLMTVTKCSEGREWGEWPEPGVGEGSRPRYQCVKRGQEPALGHCHAEQGREERGSA